MTKTRNTVEFDADNSKVTFTPVRLIGLIGAVVVMSNMASNRISAMASDTDVDAKVQAHAAHPHASTATRLAASEAKDASQDMKLAMLESVPTQIVAVNAKLDALIMQELESRPAQRAAMQRAARKVRSKARVSAGASDDPLRAIDGL